GSRLAVYGARAIVGLPYRHARMLEVRLGDEVRYDSLRTDRRGRGAGFRARYAPTGPVFRSASGSLEHFLTERYSLFSRLAGSLLRLDIEHEPWPLQPGRVSIERNTMAEAAGIALPPDGPHVLFAGSIDVWARLPTRV